MDKEYAKYLLKKTTQDYNLIADEFSRTREKIWEETKFLFDNFVMPGDKVLDLGCGNGRYFEILKEKNIDYYGVDNSEKLIERAKKKFSEAKFQVVDEDKSSSRPFANARVVAEDKSSSRPFANARVVDAFNLPFPSNFFDKIYSIAVFHHIPSKEFRLQFLREAKRVLKPEGLLVLTCWKFHQLKELFLIFKFTILKLLTLSKLDFGDIFKPWGKKIKRYYHCFTQKELVKLLKTSGFKVKEKGIIRNKKGNRQNIYLIVEK